MRGNYLVLCVLVLFCLSCQKKEADIGQQTPGAKQIEVKQLAQVAAAKPVMTDTNNVGSYVGYYTDMGVSVETGDCSGYTVNVGLDSLRGMVVHFVSHEGNCNLDGAPAENLAYDSGKDSLSFSVPFTSSVGVAHFKFLGAISSSTIRGKLMLEYPDPTLNHSDMIALAKQDSSALARSIQAGDSAAGEE